jgi:nicotinamidase-related amidase
MATIPRLDRARSALLVIDVQERLAPHVEGHEALAARVLALMDTAASLAIPVLATEHAPDRIGPLVPPVRTRLAPDAVFAKTRFGATDEPGFDAWLRAHGRAQVVVTGMEAHVCVLLTALGLAGTGYDTFVAVDASGSRAIRRDDRALALQRMRDAGCTLAGTETLLYEWTRSADDPAFRDVLARVKALPA